MVSASSMAGERLPQGSEGSAQKISVHKSSKAAAVVRPMVSTSRELPTNVDISISQPGGQGFDRNHDAARSPSLKSPAKKPKDSAIIGKAKKVTKPASKGGKSILDLAKDGNRQTSNRLLYRSTQNPIGTKLCETIHGSYWKISDDVTVKASPVVGNRGTVTEYNLTQMNSHWIKILVSNLKDVAQIKCSVRGWKETLLYSLGVANVPDNGDLELEKQISEVRKQLKKGTMFKTEAERKLQELENELSTWTPGWHCEPLFAMKVFRDTHEDRQIILVQLSSTHGEFFIRTRSDFDPWKEFIDWLEVKQANMHGYSSRRNNTEWNGFEVTRTQVSGDASVSAQLAELETLYHKYGCVAFWKTRPQ